ncbi:septal ring lytic transglycosylase RlpA family protein [Massilia sp. ZL223]|uniref:septal ring lytic transglycosylase RlpA family protein n=1 Tax=Massilia sp. ZL223 TaxID=2824904 RepID=UPI001B82D105|nr:septal ring lytic transglycosylase RlpA family protein [Massilia sp. ZL223]MBQ5962561.1 septal ring lytic transglycosylase RlpA family protein [Massilia sp. ZL223]
MAVRRNFSAVVALAILGAGCSTPANNTAADYLRLIPLPWLHKPAAKHGAAPELPAAGSGLAGYYKDEAPGENPPDVVKYEPYAKWGNRPYSVFGQTYTPILHEDPFVQRGMASWYANRFHGQKTTSGEPYDMYKMTAAHPTLPIPSYVRVTSVDSGKSVIVRINDRGPFHSSRIIDLSYTAALKLDLLAKGSHKVEIERLFPSDPERIASTRRAAASLAQSAPPEIAAVMLEEKVQSDSAAVAQLVSSPAKTFYLQFGSYSLSNTAEAIKKKLHRADTNFKTLEVVQVGFTHRIFGGPFKDKAGAQRAARAIFKSLRLRALVVRR